MFYHTYRAEKLLQIVRFCSKEPQRKHYYYRNMDCSLLEPPINVRGMLKLDRAAFEKHVQIPRLRLPLKQVELVLPLVKKFVLKMEHLRPVYKLESTEREILFHPLLVKSWSDLPTSELSKYDVSETNFYIDELKLLYENWRVDEIFKSVLPLDKQGLTSYSRIGHIVHLNLRDHLLPYKFLIGEVLFDKISNCRTVVNKAESINNTYRHFVMELIFGEPEYHVITKENGCHFEFDFSKVYWNPRLSTEHLRIVTMLQPNDVLYDVFAGVGPFSVTAAKKRCHVLANDLNPECFHWLQHNAKRNKCLAHIKFFNKDGRNFILEDLKQDLKKRWMANASVKSKYSIHITMNLPEIAVEFLDAFRGLFEKETNEIDFKCDYLNYPIVHVYTFVKGDYLKAKALKLVETKLGLPLIDNLVDISYVRTVSLKKDMYRISFRLTYEILTTRTATATAPLLISRKRLSSDENATISPTLCSKIKCPQYL